MKAASLVLLLIIASLAGASAETAPPGTEPEYYYTRVMYTGVGTPERGGPVPIRYRPDNDFKCSDLSPGEGGGGGGWRTDYGIGLQIHLGCRAAHECCSLSRSAASDGVDGSAYF